MPKKSQRIKGVRDDKTIQRRTLTAAARKSKSAKMKKYWADRRAAKANPGTAPPDSHAHKANGAKPPPGGSAAITEAIGRLDECFLWVTAKLANGWTYDHLDPCHKLALEARQLLRGIVA